MAIQEAIITAITADTTGDIAEAITAADIMATLGGLATTIAPPMATVTATDRAMVMDQAMVMAIVAEMKTTMAAPLVQNALGIDTTACVEGAIN